MIQPDKELLAKWQHLITAVGMRWDMGTGKTPPLNLLVPISVADQELLAVLMNTAIRRISKLWKKGVRAKLRSDVPVIDFFMNSDKLPYSAFIDDQGITALIELYDNDESFKVLAESEWDVRKSPLLAAAEIAMTAVATIETHQYIASMKGQVPREEA